MHYANIRLLLCITLTVFINNVIAQDNQYFVVPSHDEYRGQQENLLRSFCSPIKFTKSGLRCFFKHTFCKSEYVEEFLPHNFCHMIEFLEFGKESEQDLCYAQSTIRLFSNRVKACSTVSSDALLNLLERLPDLIQPYFAKKPSSFFTDAKNSIKRILYTMFLSKFSFFKEDPDNFFEELSSQVIDTLDKSSFIKNYVDHEQLKQSLIKFLEISLNKAIWTPLDQEGVWINVKQLSYKLEQMWHNKIIDEDELDDLFQSLLERFIYFLQLAGADLSEQTVLLINNDIEQNNLLLLTMPEQEEYVQTKAERLKRALEKVTIKMIACKQGIIA